MSKVRINDLAREMEVKSRQVLDVLAELGLASGKTHSSSLEEDEAAKVRAHIERGTAAKSAAHGSAASRAPQGITPKIDLSHISKPGDVLKAIQAKKKEEEDTRLGRVPRATVVAAEKVKTVPAAPAHPVPAAKAPVVAAPPAATPARPAPRKIVPQPRAASAVVAAPPATPAIASRPPAGPVVAKAPAGAAVAHRPVVVVAPPPVAVVVKPPGRNRCRLPQRSPSARTSLTQLSSRRSRRARSG